MSTYKEHCNIYKQLAEVNRNIAISKRGSQFVTRNMDLIEADGDMWVAPVGENSAPIPSIKEIRDRMSQSCIVTELTGDSESEEIVACSPYDFEETAEVFESSAI